ncbi:unnamed protein product [Urochloa decumbens]|uniref:DUF6598 domain-containing protein n=1 Tax=Urochloa decumbens TaxID=240449 RepID=A0ABC9EKV3_9POAL
MASGPPRRWLPTLARRVASLTAALRLNPPRRHVSSGSGVKVEESGKPDRRRLIPSANDPIHTTKDVIISMDKHFPITRGMDAEENRAAIEEFITHCGNIHPANIEDGNKIAMSRDDDIRMTTMEVTDGKQGPRGTVKEVVDCEDARDQEVSDDDAYEEFTDCEDNYPPDGSIHWTALRRSSHRDGSIYCTRGTFGSGWKNDYRIADRNETLLEAMMLSDPSKDCLLEDGTCVWHTAHPMLQIFSIKLAKTPVVDGSVELYGYIAARDLLDPLLNYIVNIGRDDPIIVEKGSLIEMTGPKRGIELSRTVLIEYDMRIKTGDWEKDDLQLIDGVSVVDELMTSSDPWTNRIYGDCGAIDITQMCVDYAFEATLEVAISEVQSCFDLCVSCFTSGLREEIRLFDGVIGESYGLRRHVLAVRKDKCMDLKFRVGLGSDCFAEHFHSFKATNHGCATEQIKIDFGLVTVKVAWSSLE